MTVAAAYVAFAAFGWLTLFQLLLAAGLPLGHMAWGGAQRVLAPGRRVASLISAGLVAFGAVLAGQAAGVLAPVVAGSWLPWLFGAYAVLFGFSILGNAASSSRAERLHGVPLTVILTLSCAVLALGTLA